jgi:hypothetical protein
MGDACARKPVGSFEYQRWIRALDIPAQHKYMALMVSTYADPDGSNVFPGVEELALVTRKSAATVKRSLEFLRDAGLLEKVKHGNRWAKHADEYRLSVPSNVTELPLAAPAEIGGSIAHP